ncbi:efflux transporter outer membrane subunit [Xanthomonas hyacinthi]|uniref:Transporter n=1 Tax=Xanthomonas hyacinthi TaxID=56455 RepID=A0A2S7F0K6_9XANT|nr:efflux transporter outer membrane subunit [Xanthomonas hyacinthi]KLD79519.1 transporter [Xanthomonas hyacinthi DSM 19077]PPU98892.1 transporter [Xanthomonas hyacinthi]QGY77725.1 efflux transporter outer membrane subunit [Xanthomonas hyacinthi]
MNKNVQTLIVGAVVSLLAGCMSLSPSVPEAQPNVAAQWPTGTWAELAADVPDAGPIRSDAGWREFFTDIKLSGLISQALENNRDLRVSVLNVEKARALYRVQRADRLPLLQVTGVGERTGGDAPVSQAYSVGLGVASFELDLFGRVRELSAAALLRYLAQEETQSSVQLSLVAEVANAYLTLVADRERLGIAKSTLATQEKSYDLAVRRHALGNASALELNQARTQLEAARAEEAQYTGQVERDLNALTLLVGHPVNLDGLAVELNAVTVNSLKLPEGAPSDILLRRPDIVAAEHQMRAANANIGAARAAYFPSISLTGSVGTASTSLSDLFESGSRAWSFAPKVSLPIFQAGRLDANLAGATADRDIALAAYEKAIQSGFRETADALASLAVLGRQRQAQQALVEAATRTYDLSQARYSAGRDSYLTQLDAQRTLYAAQQGLIGVRQAELANRVTLYKVVGGGSQ